MQNRSLFDLRHPNRIAFLAMASVAILLLVMAFAWQVQAAPDVPDVQPSGLQQTDQGCIDGYVFGVVNGADYGLANWDVHAQFQDGSGPVYDTKTNGNGYYRFENLPAGTYKVWIDIPTGWVLYDGMTNPVEHVDVTDGACTSVLFKVKQGGTPTPGTPTPATRIDGYVYEEDCEGVKPYQDALLEVWHSNNPNTLDGKLQDTTSDAGGYFNFHILPDDLDDYFHLLLKVPSDMEVVNTIAPEGVVVGPDHIRFDFPGFESFSGNQFILRPKDLVCETPTPTPTPTYTPTPTITPTPTPYKLYLPLILTEPPACEVGYIYVNVWGKEYHIPLYDVPYVYMLHPLPWQDPTVFYLKAYEGDVLWTQYDPFYHKQQGGYEFVFPGGYSGEEFTLYVVTECGEVAIMSNVDDPTPTPEPTATPVSGWVPLVDLDFDHGLTGNVERDGDPTWDITSCQAQSTPNSLWPAAAGPHAVTPCQDHYPNNTNAWFVLGPFDLSDASEARLTFDYMLQSEKRRDWFGWYVSTDNNHFQGIRESGNTNGWTSRTFDLNNWLGQPQVWVAFVFQSDAQVSDMGAFLDNVQIQKYVDGREAVQPHEPWRVPAPDKDLDVEPAQLLRQ